ncbi:MAG: MCP four helix bundle domain-containing protein [Candidatus Hydrogenedentes bacterium]|nr:MCP four helix bundle domain-containing protein [Candidatus Hydrogenedentota bacterium]
MNTTSRKSLTFKIASGFGVIILLAMTLGMAGIVTLQRATAELNNIAQNELPAAVALGTVEKNIENLCGALRTLAIPGLDPETRARQYDNINKARETYQAAEARFEQSSLTPEIEAAWKAYKEARANQKTANNQFLEACRQIDQLGIADPMALIAELRRFQGDHYRLELNVLALINEGVAFEGGDDHTACNFSKWLPTFKTDNAELAA